MHFKVENTRPKSAVHFVWGFVAIGTIAFAGIWQHQLELLPPCLFKHLTGIPCPTCGVTRSVVSLSKLDLYDSFLYNPLSMISIFALILFSPAFITAWLFRKRLEIVLAERDRKFLRISLVLVLMANWAFLILS